MKPIIYAFKNGRIEVIKVGDLKEWKGKIIRKRKGKIPKQKINISKYFPDFDGYVYFTNSSDEGKTLHFCGVGPLTIK